MMKKALKIILFITILLPFSVFASNDGISNYYIEANVLSNGDLHVKELFVLEGEYNGYERIIDYRNPNAMLFDGSLESFKGSDIYNGSSIELVTIKAISVDNDIDFDYLYKEGDVFTLNPYAVRGDFGYYITDETYNGLSMKIFNSSNYNKKGFYIEYVVKNLGIVHNDIAEIGWNLFSNAQSEYIENLEMIVNIPNNETDLRVWGHGPYNGETDIISKNQVIYKISDLGRSTPIDIRFVFDKDVINESTKATNVDALDSILAVEGKWAEDANKIREEAILEEKRKKTIGIILDVVRVLWLIGFGYVIYNFYHKHDKEYEGTFKTNYFREFPAKYGPSNVGYLINKRIGTKEFSSTILDLLNRKHITYSKLKKNEYELIYNPDNANDVLTEAEKKVIDILFRVIGVDGKVTIKEINKYAKKDYESFLDNYNIWKDEATTEATEMNFFEEKNSAKAKGIGFGVLTLIFTIFTLGYVAIPLISALVILVSIISIIYFASSQKRTKEGQEQYLKWMGLGRFIKDFGKFESRDLPQIHLWEKYLVYAVVFGSAKKLAKNMEVKFNELPQNSYTLGDYMFDIGYIRAMNNLNHSISQGVNSAVSSALSTKAISESRSSSGGGFGGGFSGGGGSFGGGGGGGRF